MCCIYISAFFSHDKVFFQSERLAGKGLFETGLTGEIKADDGSKVKILELKDEKGFLYWYRRLETPVCLTGTCKLIDIGIYWDCTGDFLGLEVYGEDLTKTDHSAFREEDYKKLNDILNDDWSILREYEFSGLLDGPEVDGVSGATREELSGEAVDQAVYTTYTLWHLAHVGEKEQLIELTVNELIRDPGLLDRLIQSNQLSHHYFLMDLLNSGKINPTERTDQLILKGLSSNNQAFKNLAFRSLVFSDLNSHDLQLKIKNQYQSASITDKIKILNAFRGAEISEIFYEVLNRDRQIENPWFREHLLEVLKDNNHLVKESP